MLVLFAGSTQCFAETGPPFQAPISTSDTQAGERGVVPVTTHRIEIAEAILAGNVLKGMSLEQVHFARGRKAKPQSSLKEKERDLG